MQYGIEIYAGLEQIPEDAEGEQSAAMEDDLPPDDGDDMDEEAIMKGLGISETPTKKRSS